MVLAEVADLVENDAAGADAGGDVVLAAAAGEAWAFDSLYEQHRRRIFNLALRSTGDPEEAEDVCQEVWTRVHRSLGGLRAIGAFDGWLTRVATRACIDASRRRKPASFGEDQLEAIESGGVDPGDRLAEREQKLIAWQALGSLAPRQRIALYLREVDGRDYRAIADALCTSQSAVETLLFRARQSLGRNFGELQSSPEERCRRARHLMAVIVDGEGDKAEEHSLKAHLRTCDECQRAMFDLRRGRRAYAALPFIAAAGVTRVALPLATSSGGAGLLGALKLGALIAKIEALLAPAVVATALTAAVVAPFAASDSALPGDSEATLPDGPYAAATETAGATAQSFSTDGLASVSLDRPAASAPGAFEAGAIATLSAGGLGGNGTAIEANLAPASQVPPPAAGLQAAVTSTPPGAPVSTAVLPSSDPGPAAVATALLPPLPAVVDPVINNVVQSLPSTQGLTAQAGAGLGGVTGGVSTLAGGVTGTFGGLTNPAGGVVGPAMSLPAGLPSAAGSLPSVPPVQVGVPAVTSGLPLGMPGLAGGVAGTVSPSGAVPPAPMPAPAGIVNGAIGPAATGPAIGAPGPVPPVVPAVVPSVTSAVPAVTGGVGLPGLR